MDDETLAARERIRSPAFVAGLRAAAPGVPFRSAEELEATLRTILERHDPSADLHVFGYGSLLWNPALDYVQELQAQVHGWHRRFCLRSVVGRGSPDRPGMMLALDEGGSCKGLLYRIAASRVRAELELLWRREMATGAYVARWVRARAGTARIDAVSFVANRRHDRYMRGTTLEEMAALINSASGSLGTCRDYFDALTAKLRELGIEDRRMKDLRIALERIAA